ncbi:DUF5667 domain-containing protein [Methanoregula sp.]|uniref:DUF5667 domain-containing protein n=1 Tax=Methanoregula sp. TaxID=2052170 RepID=UPI002B763658|nr:DUF5667 domain-containing protein [Methanoregula sp.]HVP96951.1 DUF5667 domain-containing protein [Methanoregula sp.]
MNTRIGVLLALVALGLCCAIGPAIADDNGTVQGLPGAYDIQPYTGSIGPDSSLYGLKLAFENLGDTFTFNQTQRLELEINHTDDRLSELESALAANQTDAANRALDQYWLDMNRTERTLSWYNNTGSQYAFNGTGLGTGPQQGSYRNYTSTGLPGGSYHASPPQPPAAAAMIAAQQQIALHQDVLQHLLDMHPDNPGLARAYNRSIDVEQKFEDRTLVHFDLERTADHRIIFNPVILNPVVRDHIATANSWNQTHNTVTTTGNGQNTEHTTQNWVDQHRDDITPANYSHGQNPANNQAYRFGNTSSSGDDNRNTYGNNGRDNRYP